MGLIFQKFFFQKISNSLWLMYRNPSDKYDSLYPATLLHLFLVLIDFGGVFRVSMYKRKSSANRKSITHLFII